MHMYSCENVVNILLSHHLKFQSTEVTMISIQKRQIIWCSVMGTWSLRPVSAHTPAHTVELNDLQKNVNAAVTKYHHDQAQSRYVNDESVPLSDNTAF